MQLSHSLSFRLFSWSDSLSAQLTSFKFSPLHLTSAANFQPAAKNTVYMLNMFDLLSFSPVFFRLNLRGLSRTKWGLRCDKATWCSGWGFGDAELDAISGFIQTPARYYCISKASICHRAEVESLQEIVCVCVCEGGWGVSVQMWLGRLNEESNPLSFPDSPDRQHWCYQRLINLIINSKTSKPCQHMLTYVSVHELERSNEFKIRHGCWLRDDRPTLSLVYH